MMGGAASHHNRSLLLLYAVAPLRSARTTWTMKSSARRQRVSPCRQFPALFSRRTKASCGHKRFCRLSPAMSTRLCWCRSRLSRKPHQRGSARVLRAPPPRDAAQATSTSLFTIDTVVEALHDPVLPCEKRYGSFAIVFPCVPAAVQDSSWLHG